VQSKGRETDHEEDYQGLKKQNQNPQGIEPGRVLMKPIQELLGKLKARSSWRASRKQASSSVGIDLGDKKSRFEDCNTG